jgi:hypothetical protein
MPDSAIVGVEATPVARDAPETQQLIDALKPGQELVRVWPNGSIDVRGGDAPTPSTPSIIVGRIWAGLQKLLGTTDNRPVLTFEGI